MILLCSDCSEKLRPLFVFEKHFSQCSLGMIILKSANTKKKWPFHFSANFPDFGNENIGIDQSRWLCGTDVIFVSHNNIHKSGWQGHYLSAPSIVWQSRHWKSVLDCSPRHPKYIYFSQCYSFYPSMRRWNSPSLLHFLGKKKNKDKILITRGGWGLIYRPFLSQIYGTAGGKSFDLKKICIVRAFLHYASGVERLSPFLTKHTHTKNNIKLQKARGSC